MKQICFLSSLMSQNNKKRTFNIRLSLCVHVKATHLEVNVQRLKVKLSCCFLLRMVTTEL